MLSLSTLGLSAIEDTPTITAVVPTTEIVPAASSHDTSQPLPRFPPSTRHRKSNIAAHEAETKFQKAALDACRSTIVQQEAEIKKLSEAMDIRNKKIMQLESQVGLATTYLSRRDDSPSAAHSSATSDQLGVVPSSLSSLLNKLSFLVEKLAQNSPVVNIYNSQYKDQKPAMID